MEVSMRRRDFVWATGGLVGGRTLAGLPFNTRLLALVREPQRLADTRPPHFVAEDEAYWRPIQAAFDVNREFVNLVTVVSGRAPTTVRDSIVRVYDRINSYKTYTGSAAAPPTPRDLARQRVAKFINADPNEVALTRNTTEGVHTVIMNLPLAARDEILTSTQEHGPFYGMLAQRAERDGVIVRRVHYPTPPKTAQDLADAVIAGMTPRTKLVMITHVSLCGHVLPVRTIVDEAHRRGARVLVDGALALGHVPTDVRALDADYYAAAFHKWMCGPMATGVFYVKADLVAGLPPIFGSVTWNERGEYTSRAHTSEIRKYESYGTHPAPMIESINAIMDLHESIGSERLAARLFYLKKYWTDRVAEFPRLRLATGATRETSCSLVAWEVEGIDSAALTRALRVNDKILLGGTEPYAGFFGIPPEKARWIIVANTAMFTTLPELDRFVSVLRRVSRSGIG
jgi:selenocysteine lyase/cysteine desulfurase